LNFYPTILDDQKYALDEEFDLYKYTRGLKYVMEDKFVSDESKNDKFKNYLKNNGGIAGYAQDFENCLNDKYTGPIILTCIPSSKVGKVNVVERIIQLLVLKSNRFIDGRRIFTKTENEAAAHESKKPRNVNNHLNSWNNDIKCPAEWEGYPVIVMDDVITSGSSFEAADIQLIHKIRFPKNNVINFGFNKTYPDIHIEKDLELDNSENIKLDLSSKSFAFSRIIFDLDHTLITSDYKFDNEFDADIKQTVQTIYNDPFGEQKDISLTDDLLDLDSSYNPEITFANQFSGDWSRIPGFLDTNNFNRKRFLIACFKLNRILFQS